MLYVIMHVSNNTHIPVGVFTSSAAAQEAFSAGCTTATHYMAVYPVDKLVSEEIAYKIGTRMVIENLAKRQDEAHEYVSWYVPSEEQPVEEVKDGVVENEV